jgi:hypothetical protein
MAQDLTDAFAQQLDSLIAEFDTYRKRSKYDDISDVLSDDMAVSIATRAHAAMERISGKSSIYTRRAEEIKKEIFSEQLRVKRLVGVLDSLSRDLKSGYLKSLEELIHGELFGDFLDMSQHLLDNGYKDAAAVIAGSTLESHLRQLAKRFAVDSETRTSSGIRAKTADALNSDLAKASVYAVLDQKNVTAWLDLRNKAAHGQYSEYQKEQVAIMVAAIRDFMTRHSA